MSDNNTLTFKEELTRLINKHSLENRSGTPDFILAEYIQRCLDAYETAMRMREDWFEDGERP